MRVAFVLAVLAGLPGNKGCQNSVTLVASDLLPATAFARVCPGGIVSIESGNYTGLCSLSVPDGATVKASGTVVWLGCTPMAVINATSLTMDGVVVNGALLINMKEPTSQTPARSLRFMSVKASKFSVVVFQSVVVEWEQNTSKVLVDARAGCLECATISVESPDRVQFAVRRIVASKSTIWAIRGVGSMVIYSDSAITRLSISNRPTAVLEYASPGTLTERCYVDGSLIGQILLTVMACTTIDCPIREVLLKSSVVHRLSLQGFTFVEVVQTILTGPIELQNNGVRVWNVSLCEVVGSEVIASVACSNSTTPQSSEVHIEGSSFSNNSVFSIRLRGSATKVEICNTTFWNSTANSSIVVEPVGSCPVGLVCSREVVVDQCLFNKLGSRTGDLALPDMSRQGGGGIRVVGSPIGTNENQEVISEVIKISNNVFDESRGFVGGAVSVGVHTGDGSDSRLDIANNTFTNCHAQEFGGAVAVFVILHSHSSFALSVTNCRFEFLSSNVGPGLYVELNRVNYKPRNNNSYFVKVTDSNFINVEARTPSNMLKLFSSGCIQLIVGSAEYGGRFLDAFGEVLDSRFRLEVESVDVIMSTSGIGIVMDTFILSSASVDLVKFTTFYTDYGLSLKLSERKRGANSETGVYIFNLVDCSFSMKVMAILVNVNSFLYHKNLIKLTMARGSFSSSGGLPPSILDVEMKAAQHSLVEFTFDSVAITRFTAIGLVYSTPLFKFDVGSTALFNVTLALHRIDFWVNRGPIVELAFRSQVQSTNFGFAFTACTIGNLTADQGGVMSAKGDCASSLCSVNVIFAKCEVTNVAVSGSGAIVNVNLVGTRESVTFEDTLLEGNSAGGEGGVLYAASNVATVVKSLRSRFINNRAFAGGALRFSGNNSVNHSWSIIDSEIRDNNAEEGGAVTLLACCLVIRSSNFTRNSGKDGGAVAGLGLLIDSSRFVENRAVQGGAVYCAQSLEVIQSTFIRNSASGAGGGVWTSKVTLRNCSLNSNTASNGGAVYGLAVDMEGTRCFGNRALGVGGCVAAYTEMRVVSCVLDDNVAEVSGGAIYTSASKHEIRGSSFARNNASLGGGVATVSPLAILYSTFLKNGAKETGGAVYSARELTVDGSIFASNAAITGGAIRSASLLKLESGQFEENVATTGGALHGDEIVIRNSTFTSNQASTGGVLYSRSTSVEVVNSTFTTNKANDGGCISGSTGQVYIMNSKFFGNRAERYGGCLYTDAVNLTIIESNCTQSAALQGAFAHMVGRGALFTANSTHANNSATIGGVYYSESGASLINCTFDDSTAVNGSVLSVHRDSAPLAPVRLINVTVKRAMGSAFLGQGANLEIDNLSCSHVTCTYGGCCVAAMGGESVSVRGSTFTNNSGQARGGSLEVESKYIRIEGTVFEFSRASWVGGAAFLSGDAIDVLASTAVGCWSNSSGGAWYFEGRSVLFDGVRASRNSALLGGSVYGIGNSTFRNCEFSMSRAANGAGLYIQNSARLSNVTFQGMALDVCGDPGANDYLIIDPDLITPLCGVGAALIVQGSFEGDRVTVVNCTGNLGSAAFLGFDSVRLTSSTFLNNVARTFGAAIYTAPRAVPSFIARAINGPPAANAQPPEGSLQIISSEFRGNSAHSGTIYVGYGTVIKESSGLAMSGNTATSGYGHDWASHTASAVVSTSVLYPGIESTIILTMKDIFTETKAYLEGTAPNVQLHLINNPPLPRVKLTGDSTCNTKSNGTCMFSLLFTGVPPLSKVELAFIGTLLRVEFSGVMQPCPEMHQLDTQIFLCSKCRSGEYSVGGRAKCYEAAGGMVVTERGVESAAGYWLAPPEQGRIVAFACPTAVCLAGNKCDKFHDPTTLLCGGCLPGYYNWGEQCSKCKAGWWAAFFYVSAFVIGCGLYAVFVGATAKPSETSSLKIVLQFSQVASLILPEVSNIGFGGFMGTVASISAGAPGGVPYSLCWSPIDPALQFHIPTWFNAGVFVSAAMQRGVLHMYKKSRGTAETHTERLRTTKNTFISLLFLATFSTTSAFAKFTTCADAGFNRRVVHDQPAIECNTPHWRKHFFILLGYSCASWIFWAALMLSVWRDARKGKLQEWPFMFHNFKTDGRFQGMIPSEFNGRFVQRVASIAASMSRWWQALILLRRIVLLISFVVARWYRMPQSILFGSILLIALIAQMIVNPYRKLWDSIFDSTGIALLVLATNYSSQSGMQVPVLTFLSSGFLLLAAYTAVMLLKRLMNRIFNRNRQLNEYSITEDSDSDGTGSTPRELEQVLTEDRTDNGSSEEDGIDSVSSDALGEVYFNRSALGTETSHLPRYDIPH